MKTQTALMVVCILFCAQTSPGDVGEWYVIKLKDGTTVEGKSISENSIKVVVEFQERGITKEKSVYRNDVAEVRILTAAEAEQRRQIAVAKPVVTPPAPPPSVVATIPAASVLPPAAVNAPISGEQWIQRGHQLLAEGKFPEAIQCFERASGKPDATTRVNNQPQELLRQTYAGWLQSLQLAREQATNQLVVVKQHVTDLQTEIQKNEDKLQQLRGEIRNRVRVYTGSQGSYSGGSGSYGSYGSPTRSTVVTSGDPSDQGTVNSLEIAIMSAKQGLVKPKADVQRLSQQIAMLDQQISYVQSHMPRKPSPTSEPSWYETNLLWIVGAGVLLLLYLLARRSQPV